MEREQVREMLEVRAQERDRVAGKLLAQIFTVESSVESYTQSIENALVGLKHDVEYVERCVKTGLPLSSSDITGRGARLDELVNTRGQLEQRLDGLYWVASEMVGEE